MGNRSASHLATGQVHDAANRLLEDSQFTFTYDATGNLISKTSKASGATTTYAYDAQNRLTRVQTPTLTASYRYDPFGRRIGKEVTQGATTTTTRYIYDQEDILLELDGANILQARYTHGPDIDEPLIMLRGGQAFFYHADGLGSVWDLTDTAGTVPRSYTYDSFGNILTQPGTVANPYTYTGREVDPESGLYYYRARYYDPHTGRFLSEDPIGFDGGLNFYAYVGSNPINYIDPLGLVKACSYYSQVCGTTSRWNVFGKVYYCYAAPAVCERAPDLPGLDEDCVRTCLQKLDAPRCDLRKDANVPVVGTAIGLLEQFPLIVIDHVVCVGSCQQQ